MLTLNQIVSQITNLATAHNQIAESGVGDFAEWQAKERTYPILWVFHESTSVNQMEIAFSIRLICADRVIVGEEGDDTQGHEQEVISDTMLVLLDFLAYFQQNHSQPYDVVTSATIDPFTERLNDRLAGNSVTIQIRQPFDWNKCQIPQTGASIPPNVDGLTLYNFCDPAVIARLTDEQVACLIAQYNEPCEDATITINSAPFASVVSGGSLNVPVIQNGNPVGAKVGSNWVIPPCADGDVTVNAVAFGNAPSGGSLNVPVKNSAGTLRGSKVGADWVVPDGSVPVTNTAATPITTIAVPSGNSVPYVIPNVAWTDSDGSAESTPYGDAIVCTLAPTIPLLAVTVSDDTPNVGDTITITATPTGFSPNNYLFFIQQGSTITQIGSQVGGVLNWNVGIIGTFSIYVQADNGTDGAFNVGGDTVTSTQVIITVNVQLYLDPNLSGIVGANYPDLSAFARNGTLINTPTVDTNLNFGNVLFNGVNQYITSGAVANFSFIQNTMHFTIEIWQRVTNTGVRNFYGGNSITSAAKGFFIGLENLGAEVRMLWLAVTRGDGSNIISLKTGNNVINDTNWHYVAVTYNGSGTGQFYIDGFPVTSTQSGVYALSTGNSTNVLEMGKVAGSSAYYAGRLGPIRIYNYALTTAQITNNFNVERSRYGL